MKRQRRPPADSAETVDGDHLRSAPAIVALIVAAINTADTAALLDLFHEAGMVNDCGCLYNGRQQIKAWSDRELIGAQAHIRVRSSRYHGDTVSMLVDVGGDGFYGPSEFRLTFRAGRIPQMRLPLRFDN
jgi:hypothetical protein